MSRPPEPGDRVRVKFEGVVVETPYLVPDGCVAVRGDASGTDGDEFLRQVRVSQCTLIEPEIVLPEIPGTIVQIDPLNEHLERAVWEFVHIEGCSDEWWTPGKDAAASTAYVVELCLKFGYRVIPVAEPEQS